MKKTILFVCIENSCRSQMAEAFAQHCGKNIIEAFSAGSKPSGKVNDAAIKVMKEKNIDISGYKSKGFAELPYKKYDYIVSMGCGDMCPYFPAQHKIEWDITDPKNKPINDFREARDKIESNVISLIERIENGGE